VWLIAGIASWLLLPNVAWSPSLLFQRRGHASPSRYAVSSYAVSGAAASLPSAPSSGSGDRDGGIISQIFSNAKETTDRQCAAFLASAFIATASFVGIPSHVFAEDELANFANGEFNPDLVNTECFATSCKLSTKACVEDADCKKGLLCTARCLGDSACITGCFARFGNEVLNDLLQCTIEDYKCINIAIVPPGDQAPEDVPMPPVALASSFSPASMEGSWYKVLGWNRQYDCFDCQMNSFKVQGGEKESSAQVDVDFSMIAKRSGREEKLNDLHMRENLVFDKDIFVTSSGATMKSRRSAHTEGRMFGLTFWENWYVIGENKPSETPFKFIYYTGKTLQNTYSGAFVYARTPELPDDIMTSVYNIARDAGMDPDKFCRIRNMCFLDKKTGMKEAAMSANIGTLEGEQVDPADFDPRRYVTSIDAPLKLRATALWYDILDYIEDPHEAARWMFDQQQQMIWPFKKGSSRSVLAEDAKVAAAVEDAEQSDRAAAAT